MEGKMKQFIGLLICLGLMVGCAVPTGKTIGGKKMKVLQIRWQRLLDEKNQTCERCGSTEQELQKAFQSLKKSLAPLGIEVALEKRALDPATCAKDVTQSNRIWIGERALEEWLGGKVGESPCGFCCEELGDSVECRTVIIGDQTFEAIEAIPAQLIVKAGLIAASQLVEISGTEACGQQPSATEAGSSECCPEPAQHKKECK
jgi:hypothetical protein